MIIYPAIDMIGGKCVRLMQGRYDQVTVYNPDPVEVAKGFVKDGAEAIHLVDLDGAKSGKTENFNVVQKIAAAVPVPVQIGGGIREQSTIEQYLSCGVARVILGTKAIQDEGFLKDMLNLYGEQIVVGIDAKNGYCATDGWEQVSAKKAVDFAARAVALGAKHIIYTDIATDGMLKGPNLPAMREMVQAVPNACIIASGGVSGIDDIPALFKTGVSGVIIGKAIYTGNLSLSDAIRLGKEGASC